MSTFKSDQWALVLGGSSGFGLATAQKLASHGMNLCIVHRDRRGALKRIDPEFDKIRAAGVKLVTFNLDALDPEKRREVIDALAEAMGSDGHVRVLLHSIAFGNLKLLVHEVPRTDRALEALASKLGIDAGKLREAADALFSSDSDALHTLASPPEYSNENFLEDEDFERTIFSMGTSLLGWVQMLFDRKLFDEDARVFGLTSEGNSVAWKGCAAVAAAKVALESLARSIAVEYAPHGIRCNVIQAGITETAALAAIPGNAQLKAQARLRNPFGRLTTPADVAGMIYLLSTEEAAWVNGTVIRVDGGEHISGASG